MKTIGLIGGTIWISTIEYYRIINETIKDKLGKTHSAHCILYSIDFEETIQQQLEDWNAISQSFIEIAKKLEQAGCDFIVICANTIHKIADNIQKNIHIPILHIVDATAEKIQEKKIKKVGLLGTKYTMGETFYKQRLKDKYNINTIIPNHSEQKIIHDVILNELTYEIIKPSSKQQYIEIIKNLVSKGAEGIILGCTEIPLLIKKDDLDIPMFDTTSIHAKAAADFALQRL
jgi:amino-acid racemase